MKLEFSLASTNMRLRVHHSVAPSVFANFKQSLSRSKRASHLTWFIRSSVVVAHISIIKVSIHAAIILVSIVEHISSPFHSIALTHNNPRISEHALVLFSVLFSILSSRMTCILTFTDRKKYQTLSQTSFPIPHDDEESKDGTRRKQGKSQCHELTWKLYAHKVLLTSWFFFLSYVRTSKSQQK